MSSAAAFPQNSLSVVGLGSNGTSRGTIKAFYTLGANYYLYGNHAKILADIHYTPMAAYTDASTLQIANTQQIVVRVQLQLKF